MVQSLQKVMLKVLGKGFAFYGGAVLLCLLSLQGGRWVEGSGFRIYIGFRVSRSGFRA